MGNTDFAGARIETVRDDMKFQGLTADGESTNKITFSGAGYELYLRKYKKFEIIQKPSLADTLILRNVDFTGNDVTNTYFISILGTPKPVGCTADILKREN